MIPTQSHNQSLWCVGSPLGEQPGCTTHNRGSWCAFLKKASPALSRNGNGLATCQPQSDYLPKCLLSSFAAKGRVVVLSKIEPAAERVFLLGSVAAHLFREFIMLKRAFSFSVVLWTAALGLAACRPAVTAPPNVQNATACVSNYNANTDYFPNKSSIVAANGF
jgi:hypothetical protein